MWACVLVMLVTLSPTTLARACVNGNVFADSGRCECHPCWEGPACDARTSNCVLNVETNQAFVKEEYWRNVRMSEPSITVDSVYRTAYQPTEVWEPDLPAPGIGAELRDVIVELHRRVGNARTEGRTLVMGHGGTQLMQAAFYAYAKKNGGRPQATFSAAPFYYLIPYFAGMNPGISHWDPNAPAPDLELMVAPNNPDGRMNVARFPNAAQVHDAVFMWPSYTPVMETRDNEVLLFSLSKLTGHSGSRLGWAFVDDPDIAASMGEYIYYTTHGVTIEAQYRALTMLKEITADGGAIFDYTSSVLKSRWDRLIALFDSQDVPRYTIDGQRDFCLLWVRCAAAPDDCAGEFLRVNIRARDGQQFGGERNHARINMMIHDSNFELMMERLATLLLGRAGPAAAAGGGRQSGIGFNVSTVEDAHRRKTRVPLRFD